MLTLSPNKRGAGLELQMASLDPAPTPTGRGSYGNPRVNVLAAALQKWAWLGGFQMTELLWASGEGGQGRIRSWGWEDGRGH